MLQYFGPSLAIQRVEKAERIKDYDKKHLHEVNAGFGGFGHDKLLTPYQVHQMASDRQKILKQEDVQ